jgi:AAHS family 3-hydroxyphenylpropionic acid transporter
MGTQASKAAGAGGLVVLICFFIAALEGYDIQAFGVSAPRLVPELGLNPGQQGWAASAAMVGLVLGAFTGGSLADRIGRKPVLLVSVIAFGLFSAATAMTHSYGSLLLARFATGLGLGGAMPNLIAIATEISAPNRRAGTVTTMFCGMPAGGAVVALMAKFAGPHLDWRTIFLVGGALPLLLAPVIFFLLPETRPEPEDGLDRSTLRALFGEGRALSTLLLWTAFMLTLVVLYLLLNWLPTLVTAKGHSPTDGASASLVFNLTSIAGSLLLGFVVDRAGFRWPLALAYAALALALYALAATNDLGLVLVISGVAGFMVLGAQYSLYAIAPSLYPAHVRAAGAGAAVGIGRLGSIAGPLLAGQLRQAGYSADQVFIVMVPVVLAAGLACFALSYFDKSRAAVMATPA